VQKEEQSSGALMLQDAVFAHIEVSFLLQIIEEWQLHVQLKKFKMHDGLEILIGIFSKEISNHGILLVHLLLSFREE